MFRAIASDNFPPFGNFRMDFPPVENKPDDLAEVHVLTGVNGTGKTRLLAALAAMLGGSDALRKRLKGEPSDVVIKAIDGTTSPEPPPHWPSYRASSNTAAWPIGGSVVHWANRVPAFAYHGIAYLADSNITVMAGLEKPTRGECLSFSPDVTHSQKLLQAIANLKVQAAMDSMNLEAANKNVTRSTRVVTAIEKALSDVTGQPFRFHVTTYPKPVLIVQWANAELPFDLLPDGLRSIIGWMVDAIAMLDAWLQGKGDLSDTEAVFLLDEIESHLHPSWQRRVLPAFQRLFPKAQMFVATHSPFVISSLNFGWIHPISLEASGKAKVLPPVKASPGDSYISVVEDIMGLREWYDPETEGLLNNYRVLRDSAVKGDAAARVEALKLAEDIGKRSMELNYMMGMEVRQLERRLGKATAK